MQQKIITREEFEKRLVELFAQNRISQYPRKRRDRHILLKSIIMTLSNGKDYTEAEINEEIKAWLAGMHEPRGLDHVALRRYLVDEGYVDRSRNGSRYWVIEPGPSPRWFEPDVDTVDVFKVVEEAKEDFDKSRRKRGEVRQKILDAGLELFAEKGFEAASIREIADKAGVTVPNIYYYFKDKEGLYNACLESSINTFLDQLSKVDDPNLSFRERFMAIGRIKMKMLKESTFASKLWIREWLDHGGMTVTSRLDLSFGKSIKWIERMIEDAMERGEIRKMNPKLAMWHILVSALFYGAPYFARWRKSMKNIEPLTEKEVEEFVDVMLKGLEKKD